MHKTAAKAIKFVLKYEIKNNRAAKEQPNSSGVDIKSPHRFIEVKGIDKNKNSFVLFSNFNYQSMMGYKNYYCYVVVLDGRKKTTLYILNRRKIEKLIPSQVHKIFKLHQKINITKLTMNYSLRLKDILINGKKIDS